MADPSTIFRQAVEAWNRRDFSAARNLMHASYRYTAPDGTEVSGPDGGIAVYRSYAEAFPDGRLEIVNSYDVGAVTVTEMIATGTHGGDFLGAKATGKPIRLLICNVAEIRDGKIIQEREYMDLMAVMTQIGATGATGKTASA